MTCDLSRLQVAIDVSREQIEADWRQRARIAGIKVDDPIPEPEDDDAFNDQIRGTLMLFREPVGAH